LPEYVCPDICPIGSNYRSIYLIIFLHSNIGPFKDTTTQKSKKHFDFDYFIMNELEDKYYPINYQK